MLGFGFVDNFVMIIAGDAIDASLGATLGMSTMCAAAFGNTVSDVLGYYTGESMELACEKLGINTPPPLTAEQFESPSVKAAQRHGGAMGLTIGCLLGMCPLLWTHDRHVTVPPTDLELYNDVFGSESLELYDFKALLEAGDLKTAHDGEVILIGGRSLTKVIVMVEGLVNFYHLDGRPDVGCASVRTWEEMRRIRPETLAGVVKKFVIGGHRLVDLIVYGNNNELHDVYPRTVKARGDVMYYEWDLKVLASLCASRQGLDRAFCALVHKDGKEKAAWLATRRDADITLDSLDLMVKVVTCHDCINAAERTMVNEYCATHNVPTALLEKALRKHGWSWADWKEGKKK